MLTLMLARLMRTGWAMRLPVMTEMFVLSNERMTPKTVVPVGSAFCRFS